MSPGPRALGRAATGLAIVMAAAFLVTLALWYFQGLERYNQYNPSLYPPPPGATAASARRSLFLDLDCYLWNAYALEIATGEELRLGWTTRDNHPRGREVSWSSGYAWLLAGAGLAWSAATGEGLRASIERASIFVNTPLLIALTAVLAVLAHRRLSWLAGAVMVFSVAGSEGIVWTFFPGYPDHHGLISAAALGTVLCIFLGGGGLVSTRDPGGTPGTQDGLFFPDGRRARRWFTASAVCAGLGMWVSAVSMSLVLAATGVAAIAAALAAGRPAGEVRFEPAVWRRWALAGPAVAFGCYLLERFPDRLALRLEVNHPLYHLAWVGGGLLVALVGGHVTGSRRLVGAGWARAGLCVAALVALPAAIAAGGAAVYSLRDPLLWGWHRNIFEFRPMAAAVFLRTFGAFLLAWLVAAALVPIAGARRELRALATFGLVTGLALLPLPLWQSRWGSLLAVALACAPLAGLALAAGARRAALRRLPAALLALLLAGHFGYYGFQRLKEALWFRDLRFAHLGLTVHMAARDAAEYLRALEGPRPIVLLSSPWPTVVMGYAGDFAGIGSLYWENREGLRAVADFFAAPTEEEALRVVRERGVTHVALFESDFSVGNYHALKHGTVDAAGAAQAFGNRFTDGALPWWISEIPYVPRDPRFRANSRLYGVHLYRVDARALGAGRGT